MRILDNWVTTTAAMDSDTHASEPGALGARVPAAASRLVEESKELHDILRPFYPLHSAEVLGRVQVLQASRTNFRTGEKKCRYRFQLSARAKLHRQKHGRLGLFSAHSKCATNRNSGHHRGIEPIICDFAILISSNSEKGQYSRNLPLSHYTSAAFSLLKEKKDLSRWPPQICPPHSMPRARTLRCSSQLSATSAPRTSRFT